MKKSGLIWLRIKAHALPNPEELFSKRQDKRGFHLEISNTNDRYMCDIRHGGAGYDFTPHIEREWDDLEESMSGQDGIMGAGERVTITVKDSVVHSRAEIMSGMPVFKGTRVVVKNLFDYLAHGYSLDVFLEHFPTVSREQAVRALEMSNEVLEAYAYEAASSETRGGRSH